MHPLEVCLEKFETRKPNRTHSARNYGKTEPVRCLSSRLSSKGLSHIKTSWLSTRLARRSTWSWAQMGVARYVPAVRRLLGWFVPLLMRHAPRYPEKSIGSPQAHTPVRPGFFSVELLPRDPVRAQRPERRLWVAPSGGAPAASSRGRWPCGHERLRRARIR